jgi:hypothetical protein
MQWSMCMAGAISFTSDPLGEEVGEGIGRVIGGQAAGAPRQNRQIDRRSGRRRHGCGEAIIDDGAGILRGG